MAQKSFLCACSHLKKINVKKKTKKYLEMTIIYIKNKAENSAVWTIYVKYGLKIYWEVLWKFESGKVWNFEMENVQEPWSTSSETFWCKYCTGDSKDDLHSK